MSVMIERIEIKNFRSTRNLIISPKNLAVLVGKNDSGKSNVLRALNLFFNDRTDPGEALDFDVDHNAYNRPNRKAKEISIKLEISVPNSYRDTNGDFIVWEKRWRDEGLVHNEYVGKRRMAGPRGGARVETVPIPDRSNVHGLLRNVNFVYVPAIKDMEYFSELRASIYSVIAEIADREFRDSSQDFEHSISHQLEDLTSEISASLGLQSRLALPKDLSHIFESLDFLSEGENISLDARGDGVKARHIPLILKFMADKKRNLQGRGAQPYNFIWGYEEPENSLELSSSVELADQFWSFLDSGISQILLTTHSPVFYNLRRKQPSDVARISCHHIYRDAYPEGTKEASQLDDLDERMGTTALFAPMIEQLEDRLRREEVARREVQRLAEVDRRKLFVEGLSDQTLIAKALRVFAPEYEPQIDVITNERAGVSFVEAMLQSWRDHRKYNAGLPRAAGLVDADEDGAKAESAWNKIRKNRKSARCFRLPEPPHLAAAIERGFKIPVVLETLYDRDFWDWADGEGYLDDRDPLATLPSDLSRRILAEQTTLDDHLEAAWAIYVRRRVSQEGKTPLAQRATEIPDADFRLRFSFLEALISEIVGYLFPEEGAQVEEE